MCRHMHSSSTLSHSAPTLTYTQYKSIAQAHTRTHTRTHTHTHTHTYALCTQHTHAHPLNFTYTFFMYALPVPVMMHFNFQGNQKWPRPQWMALQDNLSKRQSENVGSYIHVRHTQKSLDWWALISHGLVDMSAIPTTSSLSM